MRRQSSSEENALEIKPHALLRGVWCILMAVARMSSEAAQGFAGGGPIAMERRAREKPALVPKYCLAQTGTTGTGSAWPQ